MTRPQWRDFFTLDETRRAVIEKLEDLNRQPFKKRAGCRFSAFGEEEGEFMRSLPAAAFEPSVWSHFLFPAACSLPRHVPDKSPFFRDGEWERAR